MHSHCDKNKNKRKGKRKNKRKDIPEYVRACKAKFSKLRATKELRIPCINIPSSCPTKGGLAKDTLTNYLYYSDGCEWVLSQPVRKEVDVSLSDYLTLDRFFSFLEGPEYTFGTVNLKLEKGTYSLPTNVPELKINKLNIIGDERPISGMSYVNGLRANLNGVENLGTPGSNTVLNFNPQSVGISVDGLDLTQVGLNAGDKVIIYSSYIGDDLKPFSQELTITGMSPNEVTFAETLSDKILNDPSFNQTVTFAPCVKFNTSGTKFNNKIDMKGVWLYNDTKTELNVSSLKLENSLLQNVLVNNTTSFNLINSTLLITDTSGNLFDDDNEIQLRNMPSLEGVFIIGNVLGVDTEGPTTASAKNAEVVVLAYRKLEKGLTYTFTVDKQVIMTLENIDQGFVYPLDTLINQSDYSGGFVTAFEKAVVVVANANIRNVAPIATAANQAAIFINNVPEDAQVPGSTIACPTLNHVWDFVKLTDPIHLWLAQDSAIIIICRDFYNFNENFNFNIYLTLTTMGDGSLIIANGRDYSDETPGVEYTYRSFGNGSSIFIPEDDGPDSRKWPGTIDEVNGGKVLKVKDTPCKECP